MAKKFDIPQTTISHAERTGKVNEAIYSAYVSIGADPGRLEIGQRSRPVKVEDPEDATDLIDPRVTPEHIAEGYRIFFEATQKAGIDLSVKDPMQVGLLIGVTSQEVARGLTEETRMMLIQRNVVLLGGALAKPL
jgi:hypothetical protein